MLHSTRQLSKMSRMPCGLKPPMDTILPVCRLPVLLHVGYFVTWMKVMNSRLVSAMDLFALAHGWIFTGLKQQTPVPYLVIW